MPREKKSMNSSAEQGNAIHIVDEGDALDVHVLPVERVLQQPDDVFPDLANEWDGINVTALDSKGRG